MAGGKKESGRLDNKALLLAAAVALVAIAAIAYLNQPAPPQQPPARNELDSPAAKLLLAAYDRGAALQHYSFNYSEAYPGEEIRRVVMSDGNWTYVMEIKDVFGVTEGWFGQNSTLDTLCLRHKDDYSCGRVENNTDAKKIAASLKAWVPDRQAYTTQKAALIKQAGAGALLFDDEIRSERVGGFDTQKITYKVRYSNMTVRQLAQIGITPDALPPDADVAYWIDKKTGLIVQAQSTQDVGGIPYTYGFTYHEASLGTPSLPAVPDFVVATGSFVQFYKVIAREYVAVMDCRSRGGSETWLCLKNLAVEKHSWDICKMINDSDTYEQCTMIVAHDTYNEVLCGKLTKYADDCYISVVSVKGNFEACKLLKNESLMQNCTAAAAVGKKLQDERLAAIARREASKNCKVDEDCFIPPAAPHLCMPKTSTGPYNDDTSEYAVCLEGQRCACQEGFCGFEKNSSYYACVSELEENALQGFILSQINQSKGGSANGSGTAGSAG